MQQASDFLEESRILFAALESLRDEEFEVPTLFKDWTINDVLVHLHFWNRGADLSLNDPDAFTAMFAELYSALQAGNLRSHENAQIQERGRNLLGIWRDLFEDMAIRWQAVDPKTRVRWAGPDMSVRSSITARQMETWAHGQEVFDLLGLDRQESDRIRNIVVLGVNTFGWTFKVRGQEPPGEMPRLELASPSGDHWTWAEENPSDLISGTAVEFCQVVTQTRNIADTALRVEGPVAEAWMRDAQCFAGQPETPPPPGHRKKTGNQ